MRAAECDALLVRAQGGEQAAWPALALLLHRDLEVFVARFASDQAMVAVVCDECWPSARRWLGEQRQPQPRTQSGFLLGAPASASAEIQQRIQDEALGALRRHLATYDQQAVGARDAVRHLIAQSGIEALPRVSGALPDVLAAMQARLAQVPPSAQNLLAQHYRDRLTLAELGDHLGRPLDEVARGLCLARSAVDWEGQAAPRIASDDGDLPLLIEEFLADTLAGKLRVALAQFLLDDLGRTAAFVRQIRLDLVLTAALHPDTSDGTHLLRERAASPTQGSTRRSITGERAVVHDSRQLPVAGRGPKAKKTDGTNTPRWVMIASGAAVVVIGLVIALTRPAHAPARPTVATPSEPAPRVEQPAERPSPTPTPSPLPAEDFFRVEGGQPTIVRGGARQRIPTGGMLKPGDAFDTDASAGPVVLAVGGGRKLTVGVNSAVGGVQVGNGAADVVSLTRGYVRSDAPAGTRALVVRVGSTLVGGDGASFSVSTLGAGQRVEVARGPVQLQRGGSTIAQVLPGQLGVLDEQGGVAVTSSGTFVMGLDLGGAGGSVEGHRWKSQTHAEADGLGVSGGTAASAPLPAENDAGLRALLEGGLGGTAVRLTQALPDGSYDVVAWVAGRSGGAVGTLTVDGQSAGESDAVTGDTTPLGTNGWRRLWPRRCTVTGGRLSLAFSGAEQQRLAAVMIQTAGTQAAAGAGHLPPTVFLDDPADGLNLFAPVTLTCKADAYAPDGAIRAVEFLVDGSKAGEATTAPYVFSWVSDALGPHVIAARAVSANGLTGISPTVKLTVRPMDKSVSARPQLPGFVTVTDFERDAANWDYVGGWEFPGAKGATTRTAGTAHSGNYAYRLDYDFSAGGFYVGTWAKLDNLDVPDVSEIHVWVKAPGLGNLGIRIVDGSDQLHQSSVRLQTTNEWQEVVVKISEATGGEHWGGANDGKWHPRLKGLGLNVGKGVAPGTLWIDDLSVKVVTP